MLPGGDAPRDARRLCQKGEKSSCCTEDEGGPFVAALEEEASNSRELLQSKAAVVNITVKRRDIRSRHVWVRETSANEPPITHRNISDDTKTGLAFVLRDLHGRNLLTDHAVSGVQTA